MGFFSFISNLRKASWLLSTGVLVYGGTAHAELPASLRELGIYSSWATETLASEFLSYDVNLPLWSDGLLKNRFFKLPGGRPAVFTGSEKIELPNGTLLVKEFRKSDGSGELIETRVMKKDEGGWVGAAYVWTGSENSREANRADLPTVIRWSENGRARKWTAPGTSQCVYCHRLDSRESLSFSKEQIFGEAGNPLSDWVRRGLIAGLTTAPEAVLNTYPSLQNPHSTLEEKSRALLEVNCAGCHSPEGFAPGGIDLRRATPLMDAGLVYVPPSFGDVGAIAPYRISPGSRENSVLWRRVRATDGNRMPAIGSHEPDGTAVDLLGRWIDGL